MGFMDSLAKTGSDILGVTSKAIIEITDIRGRDIELTDMENYQTSGGGIGGAVSGTMAKAYVAKEYEAGIKNKLEQLNANLPDDKKFKAEDVITQFLKSGKKRRYEVMFNPNQISIGGYGGGKFSTTVFEDSPTKHTDLRSSSVLPSSARIVFSTKLIFDKTVATQAFYSDRLTLNATRVGREVANLIKQYGAKQDTGSSIQQEVEAFIGALRDPGTRMISFNWGDMCYEGILNQANAEYTMFNIDGQPCRGTVDLSILCADDKVYKHSSDLFAQKYDKYWSSNKTDPAEAIKKGAQALNG